MSALFHAVLYKPLFNLFVWLYNVLPGHDLGLVILVLTIIIRVVVYPLMTSSIKAQKSLQDLQPKLDEIKKEFPTDKQKQAEATMKLYKETKINPMASCLPLLVQLPLLLALFWVLRDGLASKDLTQNLYPFVNNPGTLKAISFGFINLAVPNYFLAVISGAAQFFQTKMMSTRHSPKGAGPGAKDEDMAAAMNKQMMYMMPIMTVIIGIKLPAGLSLYWFFSTVLMILQQYLVFKKHYPKTEVITTESK
jgi:YidC/Oxa1 family membrane protein insertase